MKANFFLICSLFLFSADAAQKTWYISPFGSDSTGDGTSSNPYASVSKAYNSASSGDIIQAASGNYAGSANFLNIQKNITIQSEKGATSTVFTAQNSGRQFSVYGFAGAVNFIGVQIAFSASSALYVNSGIVNIKDCIFAYNDQAISYAGGSLTVDGTTFQFNDQALYLTATSGTPVMVKNSVITNNGGPSENGGGVYAASGSLSLQNTILQNNVANNGAGLYLTQSSVTMSGCKLYNNTAVDGGAFLCKSSSALSIFSTTISYNTADTGAAGDCNQCTLYVDSSCEIEDNTSTSGDGQCNF